MDVAPTILSLAQVPTRDRFGVTTGPLFGRPLDLSPWIDGRPNRGDFPNLLAFGRTRGSRENQDSVRTDGWKLIRGHRSEEAKVRRYNLARDPAETQGLRQPLSRREGRLLAILSEYQRYWESRPPELAEPVEADPEHESRLRALGYIE